MANNSVDKYIINVFLGGKDYLWLKGPAGSESNFNLFYEHLFSILFYKYDYPRNGAKNGKTNGYTFEAKLKIPLEERNQYGDLTVRITVSQKEDTYNHDRPYYQIELFRIEGNTELFDEFCIDMDHWLTGKPRPGRSRGGNIMRRTRHKKSKLRRKTKSRRSRK